VPYAQICHQLGEDWLFHERQSPGVYFWVMQQSLAWPQHVMNQYAASIRSIDHAARLRRLRCPAVVVQGRFDRKQRFDGARYLAEKLPNARFLVLENSAHMTFVEETRAFNQALREFAHERAKAPVPA
jgi:pimeloyl-ACP methyl ester carboxylesterase